MYAAFGILIRRSIRARLAAAAARRMYRQDIISDRPRSKLYYMLKYGTLDKLINYLQSKSDYRWRRTTLRALPHSLVIEPISACNLRCPLCPTGVGEGDRPKLAMSPETLEAILARCAQKAFSVKLWLWGEPLLNKDLAKLVAVCARRGLGSEVSTHLSIPLNQARIDNLIRSGLDWLIVSNDAASEKTYSNYRVGGSFEQVIRNMRAIIGRKRALGSPTPFVEWQFVPFRQNEHEMDKVRQLAREVGVDGLRFKPARLDKTRNRTFSEPVPGSVIAEWAPSDPALVHIATPERNYYLDYHCTFLWGTASVYPDGTMAPCCETFRTADDIGNIFDADFDQIWNGPAYVRARRVALGLAQGDADRATPCFGCRVFKKPLAAAAVDATRFRN